MLSKRIESFPVLGLEVRSSIFFTWACPGSREDSFHWERGRCAPKLWKEII